MWVTVIKADTPPPTVPIISQQMPRRNHVGHILSSSLILPSPQILSASLFSCTLLVLLLRFLASVSLVPSDGSCIFHAAVIQPKAFLYPGAPPRLSGDVDQRDINAAFLAFEPRGSFLDGEVSSPGSKGGASDITGERVAGINCFLGTKRAPVCCTGTSESLQHRGVRTSSWLIYLNSVSAHGGMIMFYAPQLRRLSSVTLASTS